MEKYCLVQMEVGEFKNVIYSLYDREVAENIIEVENTFDDIKVYGVIGKPQISRSNRRNQIFFVNKRYITDKVFLSAVEKAYKGLIPLGRFGFCILNIEMNPAYVDVNVHPAKLEVRFSNEGQIFKAIYETIKQGLTKEDLVRNAIRYEHEGKGFKLEENKASFEYLKPTFHKITLNDRKKVNIDNGNVVHNQTKINLEKENIENKPTEETLNQNNESNNKNDRPAKSKIDEIIEAYRQKYSIDKDDDRINKKKFDEKVDNIKIEETEDLFGNTIEEARENKDEIFGNSTDETIIVNTLEDVDKVNTSNDQEKLENPDKTIYVQTIEQGIENNRNNIEENEIKEDTPNVEEVYNIENIIEEKTSGLSQNTDVIDTAEINKKLEEENELKFDEMYQKAFGAEVSEKRKERLKNEEKIDRNINSKNSKK